MEEDKKTALNELRERLNALEERKNKLIERYDREMEKLRVLKQRFLEDLRKEEVELKRRKVALEG